MHKKRTEYERNGWYWHLKMSHDAYKEYLTKVQKEFDAWLTRKCKKRNRVSLTILSL